MVNLEWLKEDDWERFRQQFPEAAYFLHCAIRRRVEAAEKAQEKTLWTKRYIVVHCAVAAILTYAIGPDIWCSPWSDRPDWQEAAHRVLHDPLLVPGRACLLWVMPPLIVIWALATLCAALTAVFEWIRAGG